MWDRLTLYRRSREGNTSSRSTFPTLIACTLSWLVLGPILLCVLVTLLAGLCLVVLVFPACAGVLRLWMILAGKRGRSSPPTIPPQSCASGNTDPSSSPTSSRPSGNPT